MTWIFSIRTKLFALVFTASLALVVTIYWQIGSKANSVANSVIDRSLTQSSNILDTRIESRFRFIQEIAHGIARDGRVLPLVAEGESLTLQDLSMEYENIYDFNILFFMSADGTILARSDQPSAIGVNLSGRTSLFDDALAGRTSQGFIVSGAKLMQTVAAPVFDNRASDLVKGVVVLAYELASETAEEIVELTESQIGFFVFTRDEKRIVNGVTESYMNDAQLASNLYDYFSGKNNTWRDVLDAESDEFRREFNIDGHIQHSVFRRINGKDGNRLGFVVATRSEKELKQPFLEIQQQLLMSGFICLLFASIIAGLMALGLSRPILKLVDLTKQIQSGFYPDEKSRKVSKDEVGILENALIRMGVSLREKAALENYLAELADEVESGVHLGINYKVAEVNPNDKTVLVNRDKTRVMPKTTVNEAKLKTQKAVNVDEIIDKRYSVKTMLGSGAMGSVYLANDLDLDETIAIKVIPKELLRKIGGISIKEEIRLARKITHRNIMRTYDFGSWTDNYYITMEYMPGYDLGRLIEKKGALDLTIGVAICVQICSAIIAAHQTGIIHRDLKPSNMMINRQGILKIMDFGLAMRIEKPVPQTSSKDRLVMGTPRYMAPEQFSSSSQLDERTDIYAIGIIMFTIFNGEPPFSDPEFSTLALKHLNDHVPEITGSKSPIPEGLRAIIHRALAKKPEDRFQSVKDMFEQLNQIAV